MDKPQIISHIEKSLDFTLFDCKWIPRSARFVVLGSYPRGTGALLVYEVSHRDVTKIQDRETASSLKCGTFGASSLQVPCFCIWKLRHLIYIHVQTFSIESIIYIGYNTLTLA